MKVILLFQTLLQAMKNSHPYLTWLDLNDIQAICQYILKNAKNLQGEL